MLTHHRNIETLNCAATQELEPHEIQRRRFGSSVAEIRVVEQNFWLPSESTLEGHPNLHPEACDARTKTCHS